MKRHPDSKLTLRQAYLKHYPKEDLSAASERRMRHDLTRWEKATGDPPIGKITDQTAAAFRAACIEHKLSATTINATWGIIRAILRRLGPRAISPRGLGVIETVPWMRPVKGVRKMPRRVPLEDISRAYIACKHAEIPLSGFEPRDWWRCLIVMAFCVGLRKGDLFNVRREDIDLPNGELVLTAQKTWKQDAFPLVKCVIEHVARIWLPEREYLFRGVYRRGGRLYRQWHDILRCAGVPRFGLHDLRRTGATEVECARPNMGKVFLQHAPRGVTEVSYLNMTRELREAIEKMAKPVAFGPGPKMTDRANEKARRERARLHIDEFAVPEKPAASAWRFRPGAFWYAGRWYRMTGDRLAVLKLLATADGPVQFASIAPLVLGPRASREHKHSRVQVHAMLSGLRKRLREAFGLEDAFDPVPCVERDGKGGHFTLHLPVLLASRRTFGGRPSQQVRESGDGETKGRCSVSRPTSIAAGEGVGRR